jgi:hypothetical protein
MPIYSGQRLRFDYVMIGQFHIYAYLVFISQKLDTCMCNPILIYLVFDSINSTPMEKNKKKQQHKNKQKIQIQTKIQ